MAMRRALFTVIVLGWLGGSAPAQVLSPKQAASRVGEKVTVEMVVQSNGYNAAGFWELYSEKSWARPGNFFVRFLDKVWNQIKNLGLFEPEEHFQNKILRVTGTVMKLQFAGIKGAWAAIVVGDLDQLEVLPARYETQRLHGFTVF